MFIKAHKVKTTLPEQHNHYITILYCTNTSSVNVGLFACVEPPNSNFKAESKVSIVI